VPECLPVGQTECHGRSTGGDEDLCKEVRLAKERAERYFSFFTSGEISLISKSGEGKKSRRARLEAYLAAGVGSAFAVGTGTWAEAGIIVLDLTNVGTNGDNITGVNGGLGVLDYGGQKTVNGFFPSGSGGTNNLTIFAYGYYSGSRAGFGPSDGLKIAITGGYASPQVLQLNDEIGPGGTFTWSDDSKFTVFNLNDYHKQDNFTGGYLAFRAEVGSDFYYGWMKVDWNNSSGYGGVFNILAAAYEDTPNTLILAGETGAAAVPEPASSAAVALLMGGAALRRWRKKRRDAEPVSSESLAS